MRVIVLYLQAEKKRFEMRKILIIVVFLISLPMIAGAMEQKTEFTVLQWNIWQEGTMVPGGYDAIVDEIERLRPDFVTFSEVRNYHGTIVASLLTVKTPKDVSVESAVMMDGGRALEVIETARNEYNVRMPSADPGEPFVIRLETGGSAGSGNKYRDALI